MFPRPAAFCPNSPLTVCFFHSAVLLNACLVLVSTCLSGFCVTWVPLKVILIKPTRIMWRRRCLFFPGSWLAWGHLDLNVQVTMVITLALKRATYLTAWTCSHLTNHTAKHCGSIPVRCNTGCFAISGLYRMSRSGSKLVFTLVTGGYGGYVAIINTGSAMLIKLLIAFVTTAYAINKMKANPICLCWSSSNYSWGPVVNPSCFVDLFHGWSPFELHSWAASLWGRSLLFTCVCIHCVYVCVCVCVCVCMPFVPVLNVQ